MKYTVYSTNTPRRELAATGFMSNRGRQNVASYLALDLQLDWRAGAAVFEELLLDYGRVQYCIV